MAFSEEVQEQIVIEDDNHGLQDWVLVGPKQELTGRVYFVYYSDEADSWVADAYGGDYLRMESEGAFDLWNNPADAEDTYNYDDTSTIRCNTGGLGYVWWTNHELDENGHVIGPRGEADYDCYPLVFCSTEPFLVSNWVHYDEEEDCWHEDWSEDFGCFITPKDGNHHHAFYLYWWDEENGWQVEPVIPTVKSIVADDDPNETKELSLMSIEPVEGSNVENHVRVSVAEEAWHTIVTMTAAVGDRTATREYHVCVPNESFYAGPEMTKENYLAGFTPVWGEENVFYFGYHGDPNDPKDTVASFKTDCTRVEVEPVEGQEGRLFKITLNDLYDYGEDIFFDVTLDSGRTFGVGIWVDGVEDTSDYLGHWDLRNHGDGWWVDLADGPHRGFSELAPGDQYWLLFGYVPYGGEPQPVEIEITKGADFVTLEKVTNIRDDAEYAGYYYRLEPERDAWGQEITVSATVGEGEDEVTVSETIRLDRHHAAFFADSDPDLESYEDYLYDFTLTQENTTLYLHLKAPEGMEPNGVSPTWYSEEDDQEYFHEGADALESIEPVDGRNDLYKLVLDPNLVTQYYGNDNFALDLEICYLDSDGNEHGWGTGIVIENRLPHLTHRNVYWNGEELVVDEHQGDGIWINPQQELFHVYYLNVFDLETGEWTQSPVHLEGAYSEDGVEFVTLEKYEENENEPASELVREYGYLLTVAEDSWGREFFIRGTDEESRNTGSLRCEVRRGEINYYNAPSLNDNTFIDSFRLNDFSGGNALYVGAEIDEDAGHWIKEIRTDYWVDEDENKWNCDNADLVTVSRVTDKAYKVTIDREAVQDRFDRDGFDLCLNVVLEDADGNVWDNPVSIYVHNNLPFMQFLWLEYGEEGWFTQYEHGVQNGFSMFPGDEFAQVFGIAYYDRNGNLDAKAVVPVADSNAVTVETMAELEWPVAPEQESGDYFVHLTAAEDAWNKTVNLTGTVDGHTASMEVFIGRGEAEFYTKRDHISDETVIRQFAKNPLDAEKNVFYLAIYKDPYWDVTLENVKLRNPGQGTLTLLEEYGENQPYYLYQVTLSEEVSTTNDEFDLIVEYQWVHAENPDEVHDRECGIWVYPGAAAGHVASIWVDQNEIQFYDTDQEDGSTVAYAWIDDQYQAVGEKMGIAYNSKTNVLTLENAELHSLYADTEMRPGEKTETLTIALVGSSTINGGTYDPALTFAGGLNVTITSEAEATLNIKSINNDTDPWCHPAINLWDNEDGDLTISGKANVTVTVTGEVYEEDENGETVPAHLLAIHTNDWSDSTLLVKDDATLTTTVPEELIVRWSGINGFKTVELQDNGTINTARLELHQEGATLRVLGGTLNVGMTGDDNGDDGYYLGGINIPHGYLTLVDGEVNVTAPVFDAGGRSLYTCGVGVDGGSFGMTGGQLNIDLRGITGTHDEENDIHVNGTGLRLGDSEGSGTMKFGQAAGKISIIGGSSRFTAVEVCANASAELRSGSIETHAWQGINNHGVMELHDGVTVTLSPWTDDQGVMHPTAEMGVFYNDIHYVVRQVSTLNVYGGKLNITGCDGSALISASEYLQTAGAVQLTSLQSNEETYPQPVAVMGGRNTLTGGTMEINGTIGLQIYHEDYMAQNYFRLTGADVTIHSEHNGLVARKIPVNLQSGSLKVLSGTAADGGASAVLAVDGAVLTVTGGTHFFGYEDTKGAGLRTYYNDAAVKFLGGSTRIQGERGSIVANSDQQEDEAPILVGSGMYLYSNKQGTDLEYVYSLEKEDMGEDGFQDLHFLTLNETLNGEQVKAVDVTVEPGDAPVIPSVATTAHVEVTTAKATVGALVTVQATVTAEDGKATFTLSENLELATSASGSITVNGVAYSGDLNEIPVDGTAVIVFRVKPESEGEATVTCKVEAADKTTAEDTVSFTVYGFNMTAPTYTNYAQITVRGTAEPGKDIYLTVTGREEAPIVTTVTELGTFAVKVDLPVEEENYEAQSFSITATMDGEQVGKTLSVVYNPTSVRLDYLRITNEVVDGMGNPMKSTNTVSYLNGTGMPERSFYTYIPGMNQFDFETEFYVPTGWIITEAKVVVFYQDMAKIEELERETGVDYTNLRMKENVKRQDVHDGGNSRTEFWTTSLELPDAPTDFKVVYKVAKIKSNVNPRPEDDPTDPETKEEILEYYVEELEIRVTDELPIIPIIDPSGTIYSGTLDNPVAGATVTLYYGGNKKSPGEAEFYDMTPLNQINPQITDESGHYRWNVPTGWWKVVAEKNGFRAESQWIHVLPEHTDLHLNLNMPSVRSGEFELTKIQPKTINGKIPANHFKADVTFTNFSDMKEALLIVSTYDRDGKFLSMQSHPISGAERDTTTTVTVDVANTDGNAAEMRAFLVKSLQDMTPLSAKMEFSNK